MGEPNKVPEPDVAAVELEINNFLKGVFNTISSSRSVLAPTPSKVVESPGGEGTTGRPAETIVNTFFRLIGLPAIRSEEFLIDPSSDRLIALAGNQKRRNRALSQDRTLNYFSSAGTGAGLLTKIPSINSRNDALTKKVEIEEFNKIWRDPISIDEGVKDSPVRRTGLFPLLVDASVPVYPLSRRVAPLFFDGDYIMLGGKDRLKRPFLQSIFYIRLKAYSGLDSGLRDKLKNNIENDLGSYGEGIITDEEINGYNFIQLKVVSRFIQALKGSVNSYREAICALQQLHSEVDFTSAVVSNPEERAGEAVVSIEREDVPQLEKQLVDIDVAINRSELLLQILPTDQVNTSDAIRRLAEQSTVNNIANDAFISEFSSLLTYDLPAFKRRKTKLTAKRTKSVQRIEQNRRTIQYLTGEGTGLSIFDVISVLYGLFTVDLNSLFGLLNASAQQRLQEDPFYVSSIQATTSVNAGSNAATNVISDPNVAVETALTNLEAKVKEAYSIATAFAEKTNKTNKADEQPTDS